MSVFFMSANICAYNIKTKYVNAVNMLFSCFVVFLGGLLVYFFVFCRFFLSIFPSDWVCSVYDKTAYVNKRHIN